MHPTLRWLRDLGLLAVLAAVLAVLAAPAAAEDIHVVILHTTDLHGALTPYDYLADQPAARGLTKLAALVDSARAGRDPVLLLDAGDAIQGPGIETVHQLADSAGVDPMILAMSKLHYDAMAVGNHEFDFGLPVLERVRRQASFPLLAANVRRADGATAFSASVVKVVGGVRVGIVGLATPATPAMTDPANVRGLAFGSPVEAAQHEAARLRTAEHCDVIVLLAHTGLEPDTAAVTAARGNPAFHAANPDENWGYRLAQGVPEADVILLGHTHVVLPGFMAGNAIVAQAGARGETLGRVELVLSRDGAGAPWRMLDRRATSIAVTAATPEDSTIAAIGARYDHTTRDVLAQPLGNVSQAVAAPGTRLADHPLWELVHRAQLEASGADVSLAALFDPDAGLAAGPITRREVLRLYPFDNTLCVVKLTGAQLKDVLEQSARLLAAYDFTPGATAFRPGAAGYNFDAAAGVTYEIDLTRAEGDRIRGLERHGQPVAPGDTLTVAVNSYRANGGGGFPWLAEAPRTWSSRRPIHELIADYLGKHGTLVTADAPGWRVLPDYLASPGRPLIERLVTAGMLKKDEALRIGADAPAQRGDLAYWLARAFGWRSSKRSLAFADVPDSLAPWLDGLMRHHVLGDAASDDEMRPHAPALLPVALDWCERAARAAGYALQSPYDADFRRGLVHRLTGTNGALRSGHGDSLTRGDVLGLVANLRYPELRLLETTDFHGAILAGGKDRRTGRTDGSSSVLAAWVAKLTAENPAGTVLVDGGDWFQGTMISNLQFGRPVVEQMNAMHYTASAIGNHEFDWTVDTLVARIRTMKFAALGANMIERKTGKRPRWARADTVVSRRGVRVGILGLCYRYTPTVTLPAHVAMLQFLDDSTTAAKLVPGLRARSDLVIEVGHIPAETDSTRALVSGDLKRLAKVPGVAVFFGGHSHNFVADAVNGTPVLIAGSHGEAVGIVDVVVDPIGKRVVESRYDIVHTWADEVTPDSAIAARMVQWNAAVAPIANAHVGASVRTLRRGRAGESAIGDLVADAIRYASGADVAMQNSGGLRADLPSGEITRGAVYEVMPFDNLVYTFDLTGAQVKLALEQALKWNRVTQVSGIRYTYDPTRPPMQRILTLTDSQGAPLSDTKAYKVATNDFMATGGDNYDVFMTAPHRVNTQILVRDELEKFIAVRSAKGPMDYDADGRVQRMGGNAEADGR